MSELISDEDLVARFAYLGIDRDHAPHLRGRLDRRLLIDQCGECGRYLHPPRPICSSCWSTTVSPTEVSGKGTIHLAIFLHQGPPADGIDYTVPYPVVTAELDEQAGLRFTATVTGSTNDQVAIGKRVELDWIDRAGIPIPAFRLTGGAS